MNSNTLCGVFTWFLNSSLFHVVTFPSTAKSNKKVSGNNSIGFISSFFKDRSNRDCGMLWYSINRLPFDSLFTVSQPTVRVLCSGVNRSVTTFITTIPALTLGSSITNQPEYSFPNIIPRASWCPNAGHASALCRLQYESYSPSHFPGGSSYTSQPLPGNIGSSDSNDRLNADIVEFSNCGLMWDILDMWSSSSR